MELPQLSRTDKSKYRNVLNRANVSIVLCSAEWQDRAFGPPPARRLWLSLPLAKSIVCRQA
eukprot:1634916-Pleurochrysis_carterae.AAC.1